MAERADSAPLPLPWLPRRCAARWRRSVRMRCCCTARRASASSSWRWRWRRPGCAKRRRGRAERPCGACASCRLVAARSHPDLLVLLPEALRESLGWARRRTRASGDADKAGKRKPSKEIRVEAVRAAIDFAPDARRRAAAARWSCVHPAERMNAVAANALLKTLEEPPGDARFVLCTRRARALLPTIRSRCQALALAAAADRAAARPGCARKAWPSPRCCSPAAGGQPQEALALARRGHRRGGAGARLPRAVAARRCVGAARLAAAARGRRAAEALPRRRWRGRRRGAALLRRRDAAAPRAALGAAACAGARELRASPRTPNIRGTPA